MSCGDQHCIPHHPRPNPVWIAASLLLATFGTTLAADPTLLDLQRELKSLFPPTTSAAHAVPLLPQEPDNPFAIVEQEFLLARSPDLETASVRLSLRQLRQAPPSIRTAHAACVKVITPYWHGAGVLISEDGDILTSHHLVAGVPCASVQTLDGRIHTVTNIAASSAIHDLALLHIDGGPFPFLPVDPATPLPDGAALHIVGHPGNSAWKLSHGYALRSMPDRGTRVLHFEADVSRGNSGGPIVDDSGRLQAITACAAELADGSTVKIGIAAPAIRAFLTEPRLPMDFSSLARFERNRRLAEFLRQLYLVMDTWIAEWLSSMAQVRLEPAEGLPAMAASSKARFTNTQQAANITARLLLLKALMLRCALLQEMDPALASSLADGTATLDAIMDGALLLGRRSGGTPQETAVIIDRLRHCRQDAEQRFDKALAGVQSVSSQFKLDITDPRQSKQLSVMHSRHNLPGCRVEH
jgi:hypothetical protein